MNIDKSLQTFIGGGIVGFFFAIFIVIFFEIFIGFFTPSRPERPSPPKIAGHKVPAKKYEVDFSKRYDLILNSDSGRQRYDNCLIKGFTYEKKGASRGGYSYFETWLVIELPDERLAYLPPRNVDVIEEAKPKPRNRRTNRRR